jgi:hypothetical protein
MTVHLNATTAQPGTCVWNFSNGVQQTGNTVEVLVPVHEVIGYTVQCNGVCDATVSGMVQSVALSNNEMVENSAVVFAQTADNIQLQFGQLSATGVEASIYDASGKLIETASFIVTDGMRREWSTQGLSAGVYTIVLSSENNALFTKKFIK